LALSGQKRKPDLSPDRKVKIEKLTDEAILEPYEIIVINDDSEFDFSSISLKIDDCKTIRQDHITDELDNFMASGYKGILNVESLNTLRDGEWLDDVVSLFKIHDFSNRYLYHR
jgi:hypothetical protein